MSKVDYDPIRDPENLVDPITGEKKSAHARQGISKIECTAIHKWIKYHYGKAKKCSFCHTPNSKRYHWALRHGYLYERNIENFIELCVSCHFSYDKTPKTQKTRDRMRLSNSA